MKTRGIILGTGAANTCRDGRKTMCAIILSEDLGFIRVYPIAAHSMFPIWCQVEVEIEKSNSDNRRETYKVSSFVLGQIISEREEKRSILDSCVLKSGNLDPQEYMNTHRGSIALVKLQWGTVTPSLSERAPEIPTTDSEYSWCKSQAEHWQKPYISWFSEQGKEHKTHLLGREVYEGLRKNPTAPWNIFNNLQISIPDYEKWLLMGNMKDRRNVWVGVHLHRLKKQTGGSTPPFFTIRDGKPEGWPYCKQETSNVPVVGNQPLLFTTDIMTSTYNRGNILTAA